MQVTLFKIPFIGAEVRTFGVMAMLSFIAGIALAIWRARKKDLPSNFIMDLGIVCLLTGMLGARLFFVLQEFDSYNWSLFHITDGGFSFAGAILGLSLPWLFYFGWNTLRDLEPEPPDDADREKSDGPSGTRILYWLIGTSLLAGFVVSRIVYVYTHPETYASPGGRGPFGFLKIWQGGIVFYGGLFGGAIGGTLFIKYNNYSFLDVADLMAAPLLLAQTVARWGCFFAGDDFGIPADASFPLAVRFPLQEGDIQAAIYYFQVRYDLIEKGAEYTTWVHPAQLYMSAGVFVCFLLLLLLERVKWFNGWSFGWMLILYSVHRFVVEFLRGDPVPVYTFWPIPELMKLFHLPKVYAGEHGWINEPIYGLRISQFISVILVLVGVLYLVGSWYDQKHAENA